MKKILQEYWKDNLMILFLIIGAGLSTIMASFINAQILNSLIHYDMNSLLKGLVKLGLVYGIFLLFSYFQAIKQNQTIQKMSTSLRNSIMKKVTSLDYEKFHKQKAGTYVSWMTNDINQIEQLGFHPFYELLGGIIHSLLAFVALFSVHWSLVVLTIVEVLLLLQIPNFFAKKIEKTAKQTALENEQFLSEVNDSLNAYDTIVSFNKKSYILNKVSQAAKKLSSSKNEQTKTMTNVSISGGSGNILSQVLIYLLTAYLAFYKVISIGTLSITGSFAAEIFNTIGNISQYLAAISSTTPLFEKFEAIEITAVQSQLNPEKLTAGFSLTDVSYEYNDHKTLINDLNYHFKLGGKYAIVGKSGSGKTTLLNLLSGKRKNYHGHIKFNNQELSSLQDDQISSDILYIDQSPHIFSDTIRENLTLGDFFSESELWESLAKADLLEAVQKLPEGLDTYIGESGKLLSKGQLQRLSIARGLLRDKKIILLDEVTSNLDKSTARTIEEKLINTSNLMVIMITHQLNKNIENKLDGILYLT